METHIALLNHFTAFLKQSFTPLTAEKKAAFLSNLYHKGAEADKQHLNLANYLSTAYRAVANQQKNLTIVDSYCGFLLGNLPSMKEALKHTTVLLIEEQYRAWLSLRYAGPQTVEERMQDMRVFHQYLSGVGYALWGKHNGDILLQHLAQIETGKGETLTSRVKKLPLRLCELRAFIYQQTAAEGQEIWTTVAPPSMGETAEEEKDDICVTFCMHDFINWLTSEKGWKGKRTGNIQGALESCAVYLEKNGCTDHMLGNISLNKAKTYASALQTSRDEEVSSILPKKMHRAYLNEYVEYMERLATGEVPAELDNQENLTLSSFGDISCPHVPIYKEKVFRHAFWQWLEEHEGMEKMAARQYTSVMSTMSKQIGLPQKKIYNCKTRQEVLQAIEALCAPQWAPYVLQQANGERALRKFKTFVQTHYLVEFDDDGLDAGLKELLADTFDSRIRAELDPVMLNRLRTQWFNKYQKECHAPAQQIKDVISSICVLDERHPRSYRLPETVMSAALLTEIEHFVDERLINREIPYVQSGAICEYFHTIYPNEDLFSPGEMGLTACSQLVCDTMQKLLPDTYSYKNSEWIFLTTREYKAGEPGRDLVRRMDEYVQNRVHETGCPVGADEIIRHFDHIESSRVGILLANHTPHLLGLSGQRYVHFKSLHFDKEDLSILRELILNSLHCHPTALNNQEIFNLAKSKCPNLFKSPGTDELRDIILYPANLYKALRAYWEGDSELCFSNRTMVSLRGDDVKNQTQHYADFARTHQEFTMDDLKSLNGGVQMNPFPFHHIRRYAARVDQERFVAKENISFPKKEIDAALRRLLVGRTVYGIGDIANFSDFPAIEGYPWTPYLLQHFLLEQSSEFTLFHAAECIRVCTGIIAIKAPQIQSFQDALAAYLTEEHINIHAEEADIRSLLYRRNVLGKGRAYQGLVPILSNMRNANKLPL